FGAVYQGMHLSLYLPVAIKVLQTSFLPSSQAFTRFRAEGVTTWKLRHPNIISVLDFGVTQAGIAFLVMELLEGRALDDELSRFRVLSPSRCAEILIPVCEALSVAHQEGVVHRDIKPSNIFLHRSPQGEVPKLLDFGLAKIIGEEVLESQKTVDG